MMDNICNYPGDRDQALIAYLYDDISPPERAAFESHLPACAQCRSDLDALGHVRGQLAGWTPPEPSFAIVSRGAAVDGRRPAAAAAGRGRGSWRDIRAWPAWAQATAALLLLGVSAGVANLDVRYDQNGLSLRTGWSRPARLVQGPGAVNGGPVVTHGELAALEQQLRNELDAAQANVRSLIAAQAAHPVRSAAGDADLMRRVRALVDESERRQQSELALRVAEVVREVNSQRQADLRKIDQNIGLVQNRTGVEVLRNREMLNYLVQRVSQRQ